METRLNRRLMLFLYVLDAPEDEREKIWIRLTVAGWKLK